MCTTLMKEAEEFSEIVKEFRAREDYQHLLQVSLPPSIDKNLVLQQPLGGGGGARGGGGEGSDLWEVFRY